MPRDAQGWMSRSHTASSCCFLEQPHYWTLANYVSSNHHPSFLDTTPHVFWSLQNISTPFSYSHFYLPTMAWVDFSLPDSPNYPLVGILLLHFGRWSNFFLGMCSCAEKRDLLPSFCWVLTPWKSLMDQGKGSHPMPWQVEFPQ